MGNLSAGARAQQQRARKRARNAARAAAVAALAAMGERVRTDRLIRNAIREACLLTERDRLALAWESLGGGDLALRIANLIAAHAKRTNAREVAAACAAVFGKSPKRNVLVKHSLASLLDEHDPTRFRNKVLHLRLEIRGVVGKVQFGAHQTQVQRETWVKEWKAMNYEMSETDLASLVAWLRRNVQALRDGTTKLRVEQLEARYGRIRATTDVRTTTARTAPPKTEEPAPPSCPWVKTVKYAVIPRVIDERITLTVRPLKGGFVGRYLTLQELFRDFNPDKLRSWTDSRGVTHRERQVLVWSPAEIREAA